MYVCSLCIMCSLGEGCSHVAAIMFKVESAVKNGYTSISYIRNLSLEPGLYKEGIHTAAL